MNKVLRFTWYNILTFVAVIVIDYLVYMGVRYRYPEHPLVALAVVCVAVVLLLLFFVGAQILKGNETKPDKMIVRERLFLLAALATFGAAMVPYFWFWDVYENKDEITARFKEIKKAELLFTEYETYAQARYDNFKKHGREKNKTVRQNKLDLLQYQLHPKELEKFKAESVKWLKRMDSANPTIWNVFLVGNARGMRAEIEKWHESLVAISERRLEGDDYATFDSDGALLAEVTAPIDRLESCYNIGRTDYKREIIGLAALLLLMLLCPYFIQRRNNKSSEKLFKLRKTRLNFDVEVPNFGIKSNVYVRTDIYEGCENNHQKVTAAYGDLN